MLHLIARLLLSVFALLLVAEFLPGMELNGLYTAVITAVLLGLINVLIRPVLFVLTLPITILTLGLFALVLNALLFWFVSSFVDGFTVSGFGVALIGSLLVSILTTIGNRYLV